MALYNNSVNFSIPQPFTIPGTVNGVDKSTWSGLRKKWARENKETEKKAEVEDEKEKKEIKEVENPGLLSRLKKAVFG